MAKTERSQELRIGWLDKWLLAHAGRTRTRFGRWLVGAVLWSRILFGVHKTLLVLIALGALQIPVLLLVLRRVQLIPSSDVAIAVYYAFSTIAQTTAALAGFLLAFVALRLPMIGSEIQSLAGYHAPPSTAFTAKLVQVIQEAFVGAYQSERKSIIGRVVVAIAVSGVTILACFLGLSIVPWLSLSQQRMVLVAVLGLAFASIDALAFAVAPSLRAMSSEANLKARSHDADDRARTGSGGASAPGRPSERPRA